jgi:hypothetical protein
MLSKQGMGGSRLKQSNDPQREDLHYPSAGMRCRQIANLREAIEKHRHTLQSSRLFEDIQANRTSPENDGESIYLQHSTRPPSRFTIRHPSKVVQG